MKKTILSLAFVLASGTAMAGGLNTNTAANAAYLRYFAQDANVTLTSLYANPAGSAFLAKGWHFGLSNQTAIQQRNITTGVYYPLPTGGSLPLLQYNPNYQSPTHRYEGRAFAPIVPAIDFSYNSGEKWSINAHLGLVGGGGACEFEDGIGTFDALFAGQMFQKAVTERATALAPGFVPGLIQGGMSYEQAVATAAQMGAAQAIGEIAQNPGQYSASNDSYMKGSTYMFGLQVGATYKILDNLAVFAGIRGVYATANYNGYVQDAQYNNDGGQTLPKPYEGATLPGRDNVLSMNCDQTGFGVTPILGIHYSPNSQWNIAMKYEFKTRIRLKNSTRMNDNTEALATQPVINGVANHALTTMQQFVDGASIADDIPGYLAAGVQYSPIENVRIGVGYHWIQEKSATKYANKQKLIDSDTHEFLASIEWKCCERLTISGGYQRTMMGMSDLGMNDISFNLSSNSLGFGLRIHPSRLFNIDLGYMHTFYQDRSVATTNWMNSGLNRTDLYNRHNDVIGIGLNFAW